MQWETGKEYKEEIDRLKADRERQEKASPQSGDQLASGQKTSVGFSVVVSPDIDPIEEGQEAEPEPSTSNLKIQKSFDSLKMTVSLESTPSGPPNEKMKNTLNDTESLASHSPSTDHENENENEAQTESKSKFEIN